MTRAVLMAGGVVTGDCSVWVLCDAREHGGLCVLPCEHECRDRHE